MNDDAIVAEGLRKSYGSVRALCGVDFTARTGSVLGLLGPNGAGKTTAVRVLTTLLEPDAGTARVAGLDVVREAAALRARIGVGGRAPPPGAPRLPPRRRASRGRRCCSSTSRPRAWTRARGSSCGRRSRTWSPT